MKSTFFKWMDFSGIVSRPLWEYPQFNLFFFYFIGGCI
ncbi:GSCOCG00004594001-RA-CDS [Cotesia congregata]|nr:GSCOCG00004594001-RA-CDS [Cotesia congregata]